MPVQIQFRRDTAAAWTAANPTLAAGELGLETDTSFYKIGNGSTAWTSLAYGSIQGTLANDAVTTAKILNANVTTAKIADDAVTTAKILDSNVIATKIATNAVTTVKIQDLAVTGAKQANFVVSTKVASYTLVAADRNTRIAMNSATATTITVNTSLFAAGDTLQIVNISSGVCTVTAGTATVSTSGNLALVANAGGTLYFTSAGVAIFFADGVTATASGLVVVKAETAFTSVNTITVDNVFTSTYTNYKIVIRADCSANQDLTLQLRVGGVTATAGNYNYQRVYIDGTTNAAARSASQTAMPIGAFNGVGFFGVFNIELFSPFVATPTGFVIDISDTNGAYTNPFFVLYRGNHSVSTAYDGFIATATGAATTSGTYTIYGYGKAV